MSLKEPTVSPARSSKPAPRRAGLRIPRFLSRRAELLVGITLVGIILVMAVFADFIAPYDPLVQSLKDYNLPPGSVTDAGVHIFGTDELGRDVFSRFLHGSRLPVLVGVLAVLCGGAFGVLTGILAGYFGGWVDQLFSRLADIQLSVPAILIAITLLAFGGADTSMLIAVIALTGWPSYFRLVRVQVLSIRHQPFIEAAQSSGARVLGILVRHVAPNVVGLTAVVATLDLARAILMEAGLSFLGLGVQPPTPDWGLMVAQGQSQLSSAWWIATIPGLGILVLVFGINLIGEWLTNRTGESVADEVKVI